MSRAIRPIPNTPSWRGAQFKKSTGTILPFMTINVYLGALCIVCYCSSSSSSSSSSGIAQTFYMHS